MTQVLEAGLGRDGEAGRNRQPEPGHLRQVCSLAAQQIALGGVAFGEQSDPSAHGLVSLRYPGWTIRGHAAPSASGRHDSNLHRDL